MLEVPSLPSARLAKISFALAFFASGAAALTYQFCWNRYLYAAIGIDLDSTSVIVATFMLGLGLGNLLGARLARAKWGISAFIVIELLLFGFGAFSPWLLEHFTALVLPLSRGTAASAMFLFLLLPTLLMGATLPVMTAAAARLPNLQNLNFSALYLYNTLGGAFGAFASAFVLIAWLGLSKTVLAAALCNLAAALLCLYTILFGRGRSEPNPTITHQADHTEVVSARDMKRCLWLSALAGMLALGIEIVWMRLFGLSYHQTPWVMPFVLGSYLVGLALGVAVYRRWAAKKTLRWLDYQRCVAYSLLLSGVIDLFGGLGYLLWAPSAEHKVVAGFVLIVLSAASKGAILTLIADVPGKSADPGVWVGRVMAANVAGATVGPLLTCYVLFEYLSFQQTLSVLASLSLLVGVWWAWRSDRSARIIHCLWTGALVTAVWLLPQNLLSRILDHGGLGKGAIVEVLESRHGVFHRLRDPRGDVILGANLYDGRLNLDPTEDLNGISRIYKVLASAPRVERVLIIGLGSGSWLSVIRQFDAVKHIEVVELAPAYAELMRGSSLVAGSLQDPKVRFSYTDGLRWLHRHPTEKFDLIIMNTTFYWRAFSTNLLSIEFFQQLRQHLTAQGTIMINPTESEDVPASFLHVFPQTVSISGVLLGPYQAPKDLIALRTQRLQGLGEFGAQLVAMHGVDLFRNMANEPMAAPDPGAGQLITKDNMRSEFSVYRPFSAPHFD